MAIREELTLGLQGWKRGMDEARSDVRRLNTDIKKEVSSGMGVGGRIGGGIASMGTDMLGAMGLAGGATGLAFAIKGALTQADDLADLTVALNESAEGLQRVDFAAQQAASIGIEQVAKSMLRLERSLGDVENAAATDALENLGLSASRLAEMSIEEKILALSDAFQKARETGTGMADIQDLMGRTAADLVPLFEQGGDALRAMFEEAPVMAEETVQQMARVNDQIDAMIMKSKTWLANAVGGVSGIGGFLKDVVVGDDGIGGLAAFLMDPKSQIDAALLKLADRDQEDLNAAATRDEKRKAQGDAMAAAADRAESGKRDDALLAEADKAEEAIVKERARRAADRARDAEAFEKASFSRLDPAAQMEKLRERIASSLGVSALGDTASIEAGAAGLAASGRAGDAASVLADLTQMESIAGRMPAGEITGGAQGSFATLMDQIFGRDSAELQLDEIRQTRTAAQDQKILLNKILLKMDEEPPRDVWTESV